MTATTATTQGRATTNVYTTAQEPSTQTISEFVNEISTSNLPEKWSEQVTTFSTTLLIDLTEGRSSTKMFIVRDSRDSEETGKLASFRNACAFQRCI